MAVGRVLTLAERGGEGDTLLFSRFSGPDPSFLLLHTLAQQRHHTRHTKMIKPKKKPKPAASPFSMSAWSSLLCNDKSH